jgi:serine/threonine-protein kinase
MLGEQYALAALLYFLIAGKHYLDFSLESRESLRQICEDGPLSFESRGIHPRPAVENVLAKALAKDPAARFSSVGEFAMALRSVGEPPAPAISLDWGPVAHDTATKTLTRILNRLRADGPLLHSGLSYAPRASVMYGSAGIACALHHIACARRDPALLALADVWGERAARDARLDDAWYCPELEITAEVVGRISPYHTESGVHFVKALIAHSMGDIITEQNAVSRFRATVSKAPCENLDLTLGRSGILLAASHLLATLKDSPFVNLAELRDLANSTMASIWQEVDSYASILECREIRYSGMAHGWAGILYATLCWCRASGTALPPGAEERLNQLAALACHAHMAGWCNGSAGQVFLWLNAHSVFKNDRYFELAEKAAWHVAETGSGNGTLCCGFAGQAYALLALHRSSDERVWLHRAQSLADKAAIACRDLLSARDFGDPILRHDSLYQGELGVAVLAADLDHPTAAALPAFESIEQ